MSVLAMISVGVTALFRLIVLAITGLMASTFPLDILHLGTWHGSIQLNRSGALTLDYLNSALGPSRFFAIGWGTSTFRHLHYSVQLIPHSRVLGDEPILGASVDHANNCPSPRHLAKDCGCLLLDFSSSEDVFTNFQLVIQQGLKRVP